MIFVFYAVGGQLVRRNITSTPDPGSTTPYPSTVLYPSTALYPGS